MIQVTFSEDNQFNVTFKDLQVVAVNPDVPYFNGEYEVTPIPSAQTLATKDKMMLDDVNIKAIPYSETTNNAGGKTVYIGML